MPRKARNLVLALVVIYALAVLTVLFLPRGRTLPRPPLLALRCYQSEQGHPPARLADLVTNYLSAVPQDPFSGKPMIYRPQGTNWLLYSAGPDGVDDGGRPAARAWPLRGDILFDSSW
jgi:hypothetical protein